MNYYLAKDIKEKHKHNAGSKARLDIEKTMERLGFLPAGLHHTTITSNRVLHYMRTRANVARMAATIGKGDTLVLQYPTRFYRLVCRIAHLLGAHIVTFVHDLQCFRHKIFIAKEEIRRLNMSDDLIVCNNVVRRWLRDNGFVGYNKKGMIETLQVFDFFSEAKSPERKQTWPMHKIVYAGQLARMKNSFLYDFGEYIKGYSVNVYGKGFDSKNAKNPEKFDVRGFMFTDELIGRAEGDFGLVWDGNSVDSCSGNFGEYLRINTPHKISLYIRCGLPLLIWRKAAMAGFVEENGIGICIDSLRDISGIYERLTKDEYDRMCDNVSEVSRRISEGYYFSNAVSRLLLQEDNNN